jgi:hypothetical protein
LIESKESRWTLFIELFRSSVAKKCCDWLFFVLNDRGYFLNFAWSRALLKDDDELDQSIDKLKNLEDSTLNHLGSHSKRQSRSDDQRMCLTSHCFNIESIKILIKKVEEGTDLLLYTNDHNYKQWRARYVRSSDVLAHELK